MGSFMSKHSLANNRFIKDMPIEHDMHRDGPKNYDTDKGSHAHPHDGPKKYDKVVLKGNKGDKSKTKKGKKDYESGGPGMSKGPHVEDTGHARTGKKSKRSSVDKGKYVEHTDSMGKKAYTLKK